MKRKHDYLRMIKAKIKMEIEAEKELWRQLEMISQKTVFSPEGCRHLYETLKDLEIPENRRFGIIKQACDLASAHNADLDTALKMLQKE